MLQHCPIDVTGFGERTSPIGPIGNGGDGTAYDSQKPRHAANDDCYNSTKRKNRFLHLTICVNSKLNTIGNFDFSSMTYA